MTLHAQNDVTTFLGIPVDGSESEMISKLKAKGYTSSSYDPKVLEGEFNGVKVNIYVATNNNKVCRIMLADATPVDERSIQIRFNNLCKQFENNPKYVSSKEDSTIADDEDISYEITVHKKRYEALFYQKGTTDVVEKLSSVMLQKYTKEQLANPTEEIQSDIAKLAEGFLEEQSKRPVWFMISEYYGKYYITMYYDNGYNRASGEDL